MITLKSEPNKILKASEEFYSIETHLIHLSYEKRPFIKGDSAPIYHNFIYALILLKTKQRAHMEKAMHLIERLLHFQIQPEELEGNFPRYIHEYPYCERKFEIVDVLLPIYWIYKEFSIVLPKELKTKLCKSIYSGIDYLKNLMKGRSYSYLLNLQMHSLLQAYGELFEELSWKKMGQDGLDAILSNGPDKSWGSTRHLSKMILYLNLFAHKKEAMHLEPFFNFLKQSWSKSLGVYSGAGINEHFYKDAPEQTLYHYFMNNDAPLLGADLMEAILLSTSFESHIPTLKSLSYNLDPLEVHQEQFDKFCYSFFNLDKSKWEKRGGFYPFKLMIKGDQKVDSFVLQMGCFATVEQVNPSKIIFTFDNDPLQDLDISFLGNLSANMELRSNQRKASMFDLSDPLEFQYKHLKIIMSFPNLELKRGLWAQHLRDNKRSQMIKKFNHTYDWHLYFRKTLKNDDRPFQIQIELIEII